MCFPTISCLCAKNGFSFTALVFSVLASLFLSNLIILKLTDGVANVQITDQSEYGNILKKEERPSSRLEMTADGFTDFVSKTSVLIDKSMFIKALLELSSTNVLIALPPGTGKTTLLTMARDFLDCNKYPDEQSNVFRRQFIDKSVHFLQF